jgi:hypothetical protein
LNFKKPLKINFEFLIKIKGSLIKDMKNQQFYHKYQPIQSSIPGNPIPKNVKISLKEQQVKIRANRTLILH